MDMSYDLAHAIVLTYMGASYDVAHAIVVIVLILVVIICRAPFVSVQVVGTILTIAIKT
jgi:hypothetical protein